MIRSSLWRLPNQRIPGSLTFEVSLEEIKESWEDFAQDEPAARHGATIW
jgi:hypothetical protein